MKRKRKIEKHIQKKEGVAELTGGHLCSPSVPWWSQVGLHRRLGKSTCKTT
jgi:hypothetical protein